MVGLKLARAGSAEFIALPKLIQAQHLPLSNFFLSAGRLPGKPAASMQEPEGIAQDTDQLRHIAPTHAHDASPAQEGPLGSDLLPGDGEGLPMPASGDAEASHASPWTWIQRSTRTLSKAPGGKQFP